MEIDPLLLVNSLILGPGLVWFFFHCVRPPFVWGRARWTTHLFFGALSVFPAAVMVLGIGSPPAAVMSWVAWLLLTLAWIAPAKAIQLTGGVAPAKGELDVVLGWVSPAVRHLDVGDIRSAQAQVDEARRNATPATARYIHLWQELIRDERRRRRGERVSRITRLEEIQKEYVRLVFERDPFTRPVEIATIAVVGALVLGTLIVDQVR